MSFSIIMFHQVSVSSVAVGRDVFEMMPHVYKCVLLLLLLLLLLVRYLFLELFSHELTLGQKDCSTAVSPHSVIKSLGKSLGHDQTLLTPLNLVAKRKLNQ